VTYRFPQNPYRHKISVTPSGERTNFAYRVTLGTEVALTEGLALDLAAYYMDLGEVGTDSGTMAMNNVPSGIVIDETETELRALGFSIGLLYLF
jgi:opacity protein-like surface antigen